MCNHSFCTKVKINFLSEKIESKKIIIWLYTFYKSKLHFCVIKEKFRNYDLVVGNIKNGEDCYKKILFQLLNEKSITISDFEKIDQIFFEVPIIKKYCEMPIFIGVYKQIPINIIKKNIKNKDHLLEDFEICNLYGEFRSSFKRKELTYTSKMILDKSIDEDWINFYKIKNK